LRQIFRTIPEKILTLINWLKFIYDTDIHSLQKKEEKHHNKTLIQNVLLTEKLETFLNMQELSKQKKND
jgi:hypothetical protein